MIKKLLSCCFLVGFSFGLCGCYTVPVTGRSALSLVSEEELSSVAVMEFAKIKMEMPISNNPDYNRRVQTVGKRIAEVAKNDIPNADWEFVVFDSDQINAFAMPGGKVAVYTGLLKITKTDDELAIVMGHEIAHVAARHSNERFSSELVKAGLINVGVIALGTTGLSYAESQLLLSAVGAGAELGVMLPFSRKHENEADHIGLLYAAEAGYNPYAAIAFWERVETIEKGEGTPEFLSTHPSGKTRIRKLWVQMPEALEIYRNQ
jgi:predicted Zn-dependent protease